MPFQIVRNDITHMHVDAIVNAANEQLRHGGGVCGAIFAAAGAAELQEACDRIGHCDTGSAVATPAFALPARHVIHTVGPIWYGGNSGEEQALRSCYRSSLELAQSLGDTSIAFPLISSGIYGYPKEAALDVAIDEIRSFLTSSETDPDIYLALFDVDAMRSASGRFGPITQLINDLYAQQHSDRRRQMYGSANVAPQAFSMRDDAAAPAAARQSSSFPHLPRLGRKRGAARGSASLEQLLKQIDAGFSQTLLTMIDERHLKDSEVYKRANMSRQHFSKIRNNAAYQPKKATVLALAVALQLSLEDTRLLLERAGFALSNADARDVIVRYFIERNVWDIYEINLALYTYDQPLLG